MSKFEQTAKRIEAEHAKAVVVGLGYVGLSVAESLIHADFRVEGLDIDDGRVEQLNAGESPIRHLPNDRLRKMIEKGFLATVDGSVLDHADIVIVCVPTPLDKNHVPSLDAVNAAASTVASRIRPGCLVVLESTVHPHGSLECFAPAFSYAGLSIGQTVYFAFAPERENPGDSVFHGSNIPRVVGADDAKSLELARLLYSRIGHRVVTVGSVAAAEAVKLTENTFRLVNIALVNELAVTFRHMSIDVREVIDAAATKPFGFMAFQPGPGVGGHCIPVDPVYLTWKAARLGISTPLVTAATHLSRERPLHLANDIAVALGEHGSSPGIGRQAIVVGIAYKKNVEDVRESPAIDLIKALVGLGIKVTWYDPLVAIDEPGLGALMESRVSALDQETIASVDTVIIATDHDEIDYAGIVEAARLMIDTRGVVRRLGLSQASVIEL